VDRRSGFVDRRKKWRGRRKSLINLENLKIFRGV